MLISRTQAKLQTAASEIQEKFKVKTTTVTADFGKATPETWTAIQKALAPLDVGLLINNVGLSYDHAEYLENIDDQLIQDLININVLATTQVSKPGILMPDPGLLSTLLTGAHAQAAGQQVRVCADDKACAAINGEAEA